jgi:hypothetical protein
MPRVDGGIPAKLINVNEGGAVFELLEGPHTGRRVTLPPRHRRKLLDALTRNPVSFVVWLSAEGHAYRYGDLD